MLRGWVNSGVKMIAMIDPNKSLWLPTKPPKTPKTRNSPPPSTPKQKKIPCPNSITGMR